MYPQQIHVFSEYVGGGFGGKQELLTEDLCVLAALKTGRPVKWEFTRSEQFTAATTRHPMKITIKLGAKKDGTLTAMQIHTVSNTGAYGNHGGEVLASSLGSAMATYRCPNKKGTGYAVYTNTVPSGAFRGYGATQPAFAIESAIDELGRKLGIDPFTMRRKNMIRAARSRAQHLALPARRRDRQLRAGSVPRSRRSRPSPAAGASAKPDGDEWLEGRGVAIHAQDCAPPTEHRSEAHLSLLPDGTYHLARRVRGIRQRHPERAAAGRRHRVELAGGGRRHGLRRHGQDALRHGDLRQHGHQRGDARRPEGRRGTAGEPARPGQPGFRRARRTVSPRGRARALRGSIALAATTLRRPRRCRDKLHVSRKVYGSPRSTAFLAHGFRIAVHRVTGEIRILQSVQAFDAGTIINPMQARGQLEGGIAQGIGTTLFERMVIDETGAVVNPTFRNYRIPAFADIPRSEIFFADTHDRYGPLGAKPIGEAPIIPVAPALGNALADATGIRFHSLPLSADRIFSRLAELQQGVDESIRADRTGRNT